MAEQQADQPEQPLQSNRVEPEESNLMITGPPASRTVIDNLKKLLVQRQHSRESDTENNKNAARSNSGSNSDAAFYSQFSTSSSDSDDSSDDYMIFQEISNQAECAANGGGATHGRRRHRRRRSYSSSSSSSPSPVARSRRKVTRVNVTLSNSIGGDGSEGVESVGKALGPSGSPQLPTSLEEARHHEEKTKEEHDSANSTSSHKDSSSEDDIPGSGSNAAVVQQGSKNVSSSANPGAEGSAPVSGGRCPKLKSRRDRNKKRKRSELNYATHRPSKLLKSSEEVSARAYTVEQESNELVVSVTGGGNEQSNPSVPSSSDTNTSVIENAGNDRVAAAGTGNSSQTLEQQ